MGKGGMPDLTAQAQSKRGIVPVASLVEQFQQRYPIDQDAINYLLNSSVEVVDRVVREFQPKIEGEADYSSLVISFTKSRRMDEMRQNGQPPPKFQRLF